MLPLEGIRVVETGGWMAAPLVARHLGDFGANVIKVEYPVTRGDPTRGLFLRGMIGERDSTGFNEAMEICNRNKKSIALDLHHEKGIEILHELVEKADVFITNFPQKSLPGLGQDYDTLAKINPRLVYALITAWGRKGSDKDMPGFDNSAFAMSGAMAQMVWDGDMPVSLGVRGMGDAIAAISMAYGIMTALFHRERTGIGQMVETSLLGAWLDVGGLMVQHALRHGEDLPWMSRNSAANPMWNVYQTKDGKYIQLTMMQTDPFWHDLCQALDISEIENDLRFSSHWERVDNNKAIISIFDRAFARRTFADWLERLKAYKIIWAPVYTYAEAISNQQLSANDYIIEIDHPEYGRINTIGVPAKLSETPGAVREVCPRLGQHTEEILLGIGYTWEDILVLKNKNVIN